MKYTKSELRNPNLVLLRRLQRQTDKKNAEVQKEIYLNNKEKRECVSASIKNLKPMKKTKLNLFDRRNFY